MSCYTAFSSYSAAYQSVKKITSTLLHYEI